MKKRITASALLAALLLTCLSLASCSQKKKFTASSFDYFDTVTVITGYAATQEEFDSISDRIMSRLDEYHKLFDIYNEYSGISNLAYLNSLADGKHPTLEVDERIIGLLSYSKELYTATDGRLNIAMGSVLSVWHDYREAGKEVPPDSLLREAAEHMDINSIVIDADNCTVHITDPKASLDVGAIAKGYTAELIADELSAEGITGYLLNLGGNVRAIGQRGGGELWTVGIEDPDGNAESPYLATLSLEDTSLVTSGSYQRYYTVDGVDYHHIIDPETLRPASRYLSVSVLTENSALADALSTALFCMSVEDGLGLIERYGGVEAMWVYKDKSTVCSQGFDRYKTK